MREWFIVNETQEQPDRTAWYAAVSSWDSTAQLSFILCFSGYSKITFLGLISVMIPAGTLGHYTAAVITVEVDGIEDIKQMISNTWVNW